MLGDRIRGTSVSEYFETPPNKSENLTKHRPSLETGSRSVYPEILLIYGISKVVMVKIRAFPEPAECSMKITSSTIRHLKRNNTASLNMTSCKSAYIHKHFGENCCVYI